ncbi:protein PLASTID REDOX INSENSITIVE 2, chloroplastic-like [Selaginella moellendorffii]|uniref:protein PLASTID REDOX INSENSITIVE 2, chloroplastic-like n=1 Tax=Selaginella moellendorffii TaxID=88036 RepID=UPI000D1C28BD|nr:protein PLASTID REDOX INSENSITIVE 2, chloroplastic-like [Selaginella moellendorffii]|eukprot:XP_024521417.1 protein PLASTID REDOX INSENSITIVE 2, chloroplastic-like [Selaginella moellendorffii]
MAAIQLVANRAPCPPATIGTSRFVGSERFTKKSSSSSSNGGLGVLRIKKRVAATTAMAGELASNAASVSSSAMSDFADMQERRFRDDMMVIMDRDGFPAEIRPKIADLCTPVFRRYCAAYKGTVPPEPFVEMRRSLEEAEIERYVDVLCAAIGWARWNMAKDFRAWYATLK